MDLTRRVRLGARTDLEVTRMGLGLAPIAGLYTAVAEDDAVATIDRAWERGIRLFDTAPLYGHGLSEQRAGLALAGRPRSELVLSTKVGRLLVPGTAPADGIWADPAPGVVPRFDFSYEGVHRSLEESLHRLGLSRVDILHLHDPDDHFDDAVSGGYRALAQLRAAGTIGAISAGMNSAGMLAEFAQLGTGTPDDPGFDCFMLAGRYTLLDQSGLDELLPRCAGRGIGVLAAGVYNSGLLADPVPGARFDYLPADRARLDRALAIQAVCERHGVPLRAAAIQFPLGHPAVAAVVIGAHSAEQVDDNVAMFTLPIPGVMWRELKAAGLLPEHVPTPE